MHGTTKYITKLRSSQDENVIMEKDETSEKLQFGLQGSQLHLLL
jgi:hypothetical protein